MKDPVWWWCGGGVVVVVVWWFGLVFCDNNTYPSLGLGLWPSTSTSTGVWQLIGHFKCHCQLELSLTISFCDARKAPEHLTKVTISNPLQPNHLII